MILHESILTDFIGTSPSKANGTAEEDYGVPSEDQSVKKLQAFFTHNEQVRREASFRFTLEGLQIYMFNDCEEVRHRNLLNQFFN